MAKWMQFIVCTMCLAALLVGGTIAITANKSGKGEIIPTVKDPIIKAECDSCSPLAKGELLGAATWGLLRLHGINVGRHEMQRSVQDALDDKSDFARLATITRELGAPTVVVDEFPDEAPCVFIRNGIPTIAAALREETDEVLLWIPNAQDEWVPYSEFADGRWAPFLVVASPERIEGPHLLTKSEMVSMYPAFTGAVGDERVISVVNTGEMPLVIRSATVDCPCVDVSVEHKTINPHRASTLLLRVVTPPPGQESVINRTITLMTNESARQAYAFQVTGPIKRPTVVSPMFFQLGDIKPLATQTNDILSVNVTANQELAMIGPAHLDRGLKWGGFFSMSSKSGLVKLAIDYQDVPTDEWGTFRLQAILYDKDVPANKWQIGVAGRKLAWIEFSPREVFLSNLHPGEERKATVIALNRTHSPLFVESPNPDSAEGVLSGNKVQLRVIAPRQPGRFTSSVMVHANGESATLPISGFVTE